MQQHKKLIEEVEEYLTEANEEEIEQFRLLIESMKEKQSGKYHSYLAALTKLSSHKRENEEFELKIPIQPLIKNSLNIVHGGITATLIDTAMGSFVNQSLPKHLAAVTSDLSIKYIKPGVGKELRCRATIIHKGSSLYICEAKVFNDQGSLIATGTGSFFIIKRRVN